MMDFETKRFINKKKQKYAPSKAKKTFKAIKKYFNENNENDFLLCAFFFSNEPEISYYLFKEFHMLQAKESLEAITAEKNQKTKDILIKFNAKIFMQNAFESEELFISLAVKDAYNEVFKEEFSCVELASYDFYKMLMNKMIDKSEDAERIYNYYKKSIIKSVYKDKLNLIIEEVFKDKILVR